MTREAEQAKATMLATPGKYWLGPLGSVDLCEHLHSAFVDQEYLVIGSHVDDVLVKKIVNHEYVDFARLLPRDKVGEVEDHRMELINRNGMSYWAPISDRETGVISSYPKWELAFRVFSNIYSSQYPSKAPELIQYSHVIHTASLTNTWENVYYYDREFRLHTSRYPQRSWSVILQQAWNLRLKDRISFNNYKDKGKNKVKEACKRFNKGKCHSGMACRYERKCLNCGKFGHGAHICRRKSSDKPDSERFPVAHQHVAAPIQESQTNRTGPRSIGPPQ